MPFCWLTRLILPLGTMEVDILASQAEASLGGPSHSSALLALMIAMQYTNLFAPRRSSGLLSGWARSDQPHIYVAMRSAPSISSFEVFN